MFDDLARSVASTLSGVFGDRYWYTQPGCFELKIPLVLRKDVELLDDQEQVVSRVNTVRIAKNDIPRPPKRGDFFFIDGKKYLVGKRLSDDGYAYVHEVTT